ncbi:unnamed protein product [Eruca vesicaria subsp. sativa]|uniref:F-box domain-containing protein n=1 Tax=Eruca vesicaria subsp. sativa TaxID=29727 RepID=A0ABC8K9H3_ERUVS|nr:unnamed protein product [Eruca vesicaria subsp. sativa]
MKQNPIVKRLRGYIAMKTKKLNSNSHKRLRGDTCKSWSDLPFDLLNLVFERLSFADFQRAKSVCSSWRSSSRQCVRKNHIPWVLLFPQNNQSNSCMLFNPKEEDKFYKTQDLGLEFANSSCIKTYGSWLLMQNLELNLYIVNLFTHERINLPPVESQLGMTKIQSPVFWIDKKTKDHVVSWTLREKCVVYSKTGDNSWKQIPKTSGCRDMVYRDRKLYLLRRRKNYTELEVKIFYFSGEIPKQTRVRIEEKRNVSPIRFKPVGILGINWWRTVSTNIVVTVTGDVLKVVKMWGFRRWSFRLYKVYSLGFKKYEQVYSLGDEAMLLDLGITVLANDNDGILRNTIYFSDCNNEKLHEFDCSSVQLSSRRWLPRNSLRHD